MIETVIPLGELKLRSDEFTNPRIDSGLDEESVRELAADIDERGLLYPLLVWRDDNEEHIIIGGQRRYCAMKLIWVDHYPVPVKLIDAENVAEAMAYALADNVHREDLSSWEIAAFLSNFEGTLDQISEVTGIYKSRVSKLLTIWNHADDHTKDLLRGNQISEERAYERARVTRDAVPVKKKRRSPRPKSEPILPVAEEPPPKLYHRPSQIQLREILSKISMPSKSYETGIVHALSWVVRGIEPDISTREGRSWHSYLHPGTMPPHGDDSSDSSSRDGDSDHSSDSVAASGVAGAPTGQSI